MQRRALSTWRAATLTLAGASNLANAGQVFVGFGGSTNGSTLNIGGNLTNAGAMTIGGGSSNGVVTVAGTFDNANGKLHILGGNTVGTSSKVNVSGAALPLMFKERCPQPLSTSRAARTSMT